MFWFTQVFQIDTSEFAIRIEKRVIQMCWIHAVEESCDVDKLCSVEWTLVPRLTYFIENAFVFKNGLDILPFSMKNYILFKTLAFFLLPYYSGLCQSDRSSFSRFNFSWFDPLLIQRLWSTRVVAFPVR